MSIRRYGNALQFLFIMIGVQIGNAGFVYGTQHPNVLLILVDDLKPALGAYGDTLAKTPNIDRLAIGGARFETCYASSHGSVSLNVLLTGRYPFRHSVVRNTAPDVGQNNFGLPRSEITLAELLKQKDYATAAYGKWHLGHRPQWMPRTQTGFEIGAPFQLTDHTGQIVTEEIFTGRASAVFFGFTHCPDICPISANLMSNAIDQLNRENHSIENIKFLKNKQNYIMTFSKMITFPELFFSRYPSV